MKSTLPAGFFLFAAVLILAAAILYFLLQWQTTGLIQPPGWWDILIMGVPAILIVYCLVQGLNNNTLRWNNNNLPQSHNQGDRL